MEVIHVRTSDSQNLLVTGGKETASTEISLDLGSTWSIVPSAALPFRAWGLRAISVDNRVFVFGNQRISTFNILTSLNKPGGRTKQDGMFVGEDWVLEYRAGDQVMVRVGEMTVGRVQHAVSVWDQQISYC